MPTEKFPSDIALRNSIEELIERARLHRSCITCNHFNEEHELCALAQGRPPARVIAFACPRYDEVPPF